MAKQLQMGWVGTFFNLNLRLEVCNLQLNWHNFADILISSDVMKRMKTPISKAFKGRFNVMRGSTTNMGTITATKPLISRF